MKNIKKALFVTMLSILAIFSFTGCELNNPNLIASSASGDEVVKTVKNKISEISPTNAYLENGSTTEQTEYAAQFEIMLAECKENNKIGYIDLYKSPVFTPQTFVNSTNNETTNAFLYYLSTISPVALKVSVTKEDALLYLNNYYVYGENFTKEHCKYIAEYYGVSEGVIIDSIVYHDGQIIFVFLKNLDDIDDARSVAMNISPYMSSFRSFVEMLAKEAGEYTGDDYSFFFDNTSTDSDKN